MVVSNVINDLIDFLFFSSVKQMTFLLPLRELCGHYSVKNVALSQDHSVHFY